MNFVCWFGLRGEEADTRELEVSPRAAGDVFVLSLATPCSDEWLDGVCHSLPGGVCGFLDKCCKTVCVGDGEEGMLTWSYSNAPG